MFTNGKLKKIVALLSAAAITLIGSVSALAAPFGHSNIDSIRSKALSSYLSSSNIVSMAEGKAPSSESSFIKEEAVVAYANTVVTEPVAYTTIKRLNPSLAPGETTVVREGIEGEKTVTYRVKSENGREISKEVLESCVTKNPVSKIVEYGSDDSLTVTTSAPGASSETAKLDYKYVIECKATAYDMSPEENGGYAGQSATGVPLEKGVIAVDPRVIPLGTRVYVEALDGSWSYGYAVAADTGGAIKGNRVDLCFRTQSECIQFGVRPCRVYILN